MSRFDVRAALASLRTNADHEMRLPLADWCEEQLMSAAAARLRSEEIGPRVHALAALEGVFGDASDEPPPSQHRIALPFPACKVCNYEEVVLTVEVPRPLALKHIVVMAEPPFLVHQILAGHWNCLDTADPVDSRLFGPDTRLSFDDVPHVYAGQTLTVTVESRHLTGREARDCHVVALCDPLPPYDPLPSYRDPMGQIARRDPLYEDPVAARIAAAPSVDEAWRLYEEARTEEARAEPLPEGVPDPYRLPVPEGYEWQGELFPNPGVPAHLLPAPEGHEWRWSDRRWVLAPKG